MKKAIVIGAISGIGKGLSKLLLANGYNVGITGRRTNLLLELKKESPDRYIVKPMDVTDINNLVEKLQELLTELGGLDLLVISAGAGDLNERLDFTIEKVAIDTNVSGFTFIADWAFKYFENQRYGHLVAISSIAGLRGSRQAPAYNATKAFQINYLEGLRRKAKKSEHAIVVTDIRPGFVDTAMAKGDGQFWVSTVDKATKQIFGAIINKKKIAYITKRWEVIAILVRNLPRFLYDRM